MHESVEISNKHLESFWNVGRKYAREFEWDNLKFTEILINLGGCRKMMVWIYCLLRNYGKITALKDLPKEQKEEMWLFIKDLCGEKKTDLELCRQMCMAFYALEYFLNEQK